MTRNFEITSIYNKIMGLMVVPGGRRKFPCVILSHGLVSSKESSKYTLVSRYLCQGWYRDVQI